MTDIHSCSLYCDRPECVKAQRDDLRADLERLKSDLSGYMQHATAEPDMRHPKIQALISQNARQSIWMRLVEQLIEDPHFETSSMDMEYWDGTHDKIKEALTARAQPAQRMPLVQATAPREIWLQISDDERDNAETFPDGFDGITWSKDSATVCGVPYVRADLAQAQPAPAQEPQRRLSSLGMAKAVMETGDPMAFGRVDPVWLEKYTRATEAAIVPQWQPIDSAPKDELILVGPTKRMGICAAMHHSRDGWVTETTSEWVTMYPPTQWMPLPPEPKDAA